MSEKPICPLFLIRDCAACYANCEQSGAPVSVPKCFKFRKFPDKTSLSILNNDAQSV